MAAEMLEPLPMALELTTLATTQLVLTLPMLATNSTQEWTAIVMEAATPVLPHTAQVPTTPLLPTPLAHTAQTS